MHRSVPPSSRWPAPPRPAYSLFFMAPAMDPDIARGTLPLAISAQEYGYRLGVSARRADAQAAAPLAFGPLIVRWAAAC